MQLPCVLMSFAFVIVWADIMTYMRVVTNTNRHIEQAYANYNNLRGNGLEHVIRRIVCENEYTFDQMNFMIAVPERAKFTNLPEAVFTQIALQGKISFELYFGNVNLTELGNLRRVLTKKALNNIIRRALNVNEKDVTLSQLCYFIGLWMSAKIPTLYTNFIDTDSDNICILKDESDHVIKYRSIGGIFYQVDVDNLDYKIITLEEQLY
ncbi:uncharacterized protein LOC126847996 isoform X2 [Adelges cooleyi]|uniref:uncharacterized protein LOC126848021 isoform X13 n=1 Tax=Adelges cooleyi TaxID=133065 RepID=UPI0021801B21|nr:uncharacterized protein LOC126848021 isoform X13 [Adelges cooleyi]XP_050419641.1 uncharacterized protein LOC126848021 isoform X14 [Adelges cooleyi]XP_050419649.1 uncharacterized protein LOC126848021 isoform X15 [Adelges cooleyi]XP_050419658.1 uncharacterized protein LOC126848021 isoform X16 [Adelges cooleyi]XP_050419668.1 uncharacterized protein LOC126848021 isoform X17 [Adelges cooleyi]XP_050419677.1 uncharacterized protein LOC126848021 isoform X18 [Adelges cooleyi]XP_050419686.1 uncharac